MDLIQSNQWSRLSVEQRHLHLWAVARYREEGGQAFPLDGSVTEIMSPLNGTSVQFTPIDLETLQKEGLIHYRRTAANAYRIEPTPDGLAVEDAVQKTKESIELQVRAHPFAIAKNGILAAAVSEFAARCGSVPDDQLLLDLWRDYVDPPSRQFFLYAEFSERVKERLHQEKSTAARQRDDLGSAARRSEIPTDADAARKIETNERSTGSDLKQEDLAGQFEQSQNSNEARAAIIDSAQYFTRLPGFAAADAKLRKLTEPILEELQSQPLPRPQAIGWFDGHAAAYLALVKDRQSWEAYRILLYSLWYPQAYEYLFGSVCMQPRLPEGIELRSRLDARRRHWHKRASKAWAASTAPNCADNLTRRDASESAASRRANKISENPSRVEAGELGSGPGSTTGQGPTPHDFLARLSPNDPNYEVGRRFYLKAWADSHGLVANALAGHAEFPDLIDACVRTFGEAAEAQVAFVDATPVYEVCGELDRAAKLYIAKFSESLFAESDRIGDEQVQAAVDELSRRVNEIAARSKQRILKRELDGLPEAPTFDPASGGGALQGRRSVKARPIRRNNRSKLIDSTLESIAQAAPMTQEEIFSVLQSRRAALPMAEPFLSSGGWMPGFRKNERLARAWLSKRWAELSLPPLPRGPKISQK